MVTMDSDHGQCKALRPWPPRTQTMDNVIYSDHGLRPWTMDGLDHHKNDGYHGHNEL